MTALLALLLCCAVLFLLPLIPAVLEWWRPTDADPVVVKDDYKDKLDYYRVRYRLLIETQLRSFMEQAQADGHQVDADFPERHIRLSALPSQQTTPRLPEQEARARETGRMILAAGDLTLPGDIVFSYAAYADGVLRGGAGLVVRALMSRQDIDLGENARLLRWAHADGAFLARKGCQLFGRVTAGRELRLESGCEFHRIHAPRIETRARGEASSAESGAVREDVLIVPDRDLQSAERKRQTGSLTIADGASHHGDLVLSEDLSLGFKASVVGSVKGNRDIVLGTGSRVHGSVVAGVRVVMRQGSQAMGPVIASDVVEIGPDCVIGAPDRLTTVTAPEIRVAPGAVVHGTIWAVKKGQVL
jgi:cytoskeletal protein CcmA (bactofilin family)